VGYCLRLRRALGAAKPGAVITIHSIAVFNIIGLAVGAEHGGWLVLALTGDQCARARNGSIIMLASWVIDAVAASRAPSALQASELSE